jgi:hypothetical protein
MPSGWIDAKAHREAGAVNDGQANGRTDGNASRWTASWLVTGTLFVPSFFTLSWPVLIICKEQIAYFDKHTHASSSKLNRNFVCAHVCGVISHFVNLLVIYNKRGGGGESLLN